MTAPTSCRCVTTAKLQERPSSKGREERRCRTLRPFPPRHSSNLSSNAMHLARSLALFLVAGICEIGGGYLVWLWLRDRRSAALGALGGLLLFLYGVLPTLQPAHFGRVYAAYGGVFVVLSLLWGWWVDGHRPDMADVTGAAICVVGVCVIMYWPRGG